MFCLAKSTAAGSTLIEAMMAAGISALFLGSLFAINTSSMQTIKMAREAAAASQVLQQRVESMRIANWHQITDADWIKANLLNADAPGSVDLKSISETLTIVPYGSGNTGNTLISRKNGSAVILQRNTALLNESAVEIIWTVNYTGAPNERPTARQTVAILAKGGVAK
jgi:type II secretory pathway pseudopilin PulG